MYNAIYKVPKAINEPVKPYAPGTPERESLLATFRAMKSTNYDIPMFIDGKEVRTDNNPTLHPPFEHKHVLGKYHKGNKQHVEAAISAALAAKADWEALPWYERANIFLKAADLVAGPYRDKINAATMLGQSKNAHQAEIDAACELIDFLRFNVEFMTEIYQEQPISSPGMWNRVDYRPLEGFVLAITPFNFTAIAGNLPSSAALMGNTVVWKPSDTQIYSANIIMDIFREAGLPKGVINMVFCDGPVAGETAFNHPELAGVHFTGSTGTFQYMWKAVGDNIHKYRSYPRIVGETGGKDFVFVHPSFTNAKKIATALSRSSFEFQGQKCSAASRAYIPKSIWPQVKEFLLADIASFKMGSPEDLGNFINAVIDERSFDKIANYIDKAKQDGQEIIAGGNYDKSVGYFIEPTVIVANKPDYTTMCEEIFGPVLTVYVYDDEKIDETLDLVDNTSPYALTGSIFGKGRIEIDKMTYRLRHAAGNFYVNDKPTGSVVGQQPFGGARASGTNDKAGSKMNLMRWVSARTIKETYNAAEDYRYPFLG